MAELVGSQDTTRSDVRARAKDKVRAAEAKLRRYRAATDAGVDPAALVESKNEAQAQRVAAEAALANVPDAGGLITDAEIHAMIDSPGDVRATIEMRSRSRSRGSTDR